MNHRIELRAVEADAAVCLSLPCLPEKTKYNTEARGRETSVMRKQHPGVIFAPADLLPCSRDQCSSNYAETLHLPNILNCIPPSASHVYLSFQSCLHHIQTQPGLCTLLECTATPGAGMTVVLQLAILFINCSLRGRFVDSSALESAAAE